MEQWTPTARELADLELVSIGAWPSDLSFDVAVPDELAEGEVELLDPEGLPLAAVDLARGTVEIRGEIAHGPFRHLHLRPSEVRGAHPHAFAIPVRDALTEDDAVAILDHARTSGKRPVVVVLTGPGMSLRMSAPALVRATRSAVRDIGAAVVIAAAAAARDDAEHTARFATQVAAAYADDVLIPTGRGEPSVEVRAILEHDRPPLDRGGLVVFFTGLSGSGKSTLARALHDVLLEAGDRTVSTLDGDVVRHHLSKGLGFSEEDRETNIARIGWVAAEIARHHGVAICSPIAPFEATRALARTMVQDAGGAFALVHVATPLSECERRDRKGLYAKARVGQIPEFTGISSPYEVPPDALVTVDTTGRTIAETLDEVLVALRGAGLIADA